MTPLLYAAAECANYLPGGACLNVNFGQRGENICHPSRPTCLLASDKPCSYFEQCVVLTHTIEPDPKKSKTYQEAAYTYLMAHGRNLVGRKCPDCGGQMGAGRRFCQMCSDKRRKTAWRRRYAIRRGMGDASTTVVGKSTPNSLANSVGFSAICPKPYQDSHPPQNEATTVGIRGTR